ncbi:MAG: hypothetical protein K2J28_01560, partial [Duncaniella sp.]|nr:hypothetical protein [Duncaniella sp.]
MKIGIIQQHNTADIENNRRRLCEKVIELGKRGAELVVLQELHDLLELLLLLGGPGHVVEGDPLAPVRERPGPGRAEPGHPVAA